MADEGETSNEKKSLIKAKSYNSRPLLKINTGLAKRKSYNTNDAVRSVDIALGRLKKSKLVDGDYTSNTAHTSPVRRSLASGHIFLDSLTEPNYNSGVDSASIMSMNFSHYELMRNLSYSNCNSDGAFSCTTSSAYMNAADVISKNEHLERYFRSAEMWSKNNDADPSTAPLDMPDK